MTALAIALGWTSTLALVGFLVHLRFKYGPPQVISADAFARAVLELEELKTKVQGMSASLALGGRR